jgi:hypothetical protein
MKHTWDTTSNGITSLDLDKPHRVPNSSFLLRRLAIDKMTGATFIRTSFDSESYTYCPVITCLTETGSDVDFSGMYRIDDESVGNTNAVPSICLRTAHWSNYDAERVLVNGNRMAPIDVLSQKHLQIRTRFFTTDALSELLTAGSNLAEVASAGLAFDKVEQIANPISWRSIRSDQSGIDASWAYSPRTRLCLALENWCVSWQRCLIAVAQAPGLLPTGNFYVNYPASLWERLQLYGP